MPSRPVDSPDGSGILASTLSPNDSRHDRARWHYKRSLASRVAVLTAVVVGLSIGVICLSAYIVLRNQMQAKLDASLIQRAEAAARTPALSSVSTRVPSWALGAADVRIYFVTSNGLLRRTDNLAPLPFGQSEVDVARGVSPHELRSVSHDGEHYRIVAVPSAEPGQALIIAQSMEIQERILRDMGFVALALGGLGVVAAAVAGWTVARAGLRPLRRLATAVDTIARTKELKRLPVQGDDEIAQLSVAFNALLDTLAASADRQRQLVADAGHELRTPLTSIRTNLELLIQADTAGVDFARDEKRDLMTDIQTQLNEITSLVGDLIELARDEPRTVALERFDLADVVQRAVTRVKLRAPQVDFAVDTDSWHVQGESALIERAVANLLDNAAKWSPPRGVVNVELVDGRLTVSDRGPGVSAEDLPHVFERFWRSPASRAMPGSGLGLAIVQDAVHRHGGTVSASSTLGDGTTFRMWLPQSEAKARAEAGVPGESSHP